jgi:hypothetical protein
MFYHGSEASQSLIYPDGRQRKKEKVISSPPPWTKLCQSPFSDDAFTTSGFAFFCVSLSPLLFSFRR